MSNQPEAPTYDAGVYQIETADAVQGGVGGKANAPLLNLANRTAYLKQHLDAIESGAEIPPGLAPINSPNFIGTPTTPSPADGDSSLKIPSTAWAQNLKGGVSSVNVAGGANVVLTAAQAGRGIIILTGAITANINVVFPNNGAWIVINSSTGNFNITCKTAAGTGIVVGQSLANMLAADGTNVVDARTDFTRSFPSQTIHANTGGGNGYQKFPNGVIIQWGAVGNTANVSVSSYSLDTTFPIAFPNFALSIAFGSGIDTSNLDGVSGARSSTQNLTCSNMSTTGFQLQLNLDNNNGLARNVRYIVIGF